MYGTFNRVYRVGCLGSWCSTMVLYRRETSSTLKAVNVPLDSIHNTQTPLLYAARTSNSLSFSLSKIVVLENSKTNKFEKHFLKGIGHIVFILSWLLQEKRLWWIAIYLAPFEFSRLLCPHEISHSDPKSTIPLENSVLFSY